MAWKMLLRVYGWGGKKGKSVIKNYIAMEETVKLKK